MSTAHPIGPLNNGISDMLIFLGVEDPVEGVAAAADRKDGPVDPLPLLSSITDEERDIIALQDGVAVRLRASPYYIVEPQKKEDSTRYSDKFLKSTAPIKLQAKDLNPAFFPPDLWDAYFNPKKRKAKKAKERARLNLDNLEANEEDEEGSEKGSGAGSDEEDQVDYDDENEDENDYADNYFDNGEDEDHGDDGEDGGGTYD
ncbi:hypothetical protein RSAG8_04519, partial [Rhizoctonia solani AG-8 WAC10335]